MEARLKESHFRNYHRLDAVDGRNMTIDDVKRVVSDSTLTFLGKHPQTIGSYLLFSAISVAPDTHLFICSRLRPRAFVI